METELHGVSLELGALLKDSAQCCKIPYDIEIII